MISVSNSTTIFIVLSCALSLMFAFCQYVAISMTKIISKGGSEEQKEYTPLMGKATLERNERTVKLREIHNAISIGAEAFLRAEYGICSAFTIIFALVVFVLVTWGEDSFALGGLTVLSFLLGACTSVLSGYIGMKVAVFSNVRTTINAEKIGNFVDCFNTAFRAGTVMGFCLCGLGILVLYMSLLCYRLYFPVQNWEKMMNCIAGYGLGGSFIAMFARVGGGIYTKAADVGADLVGKVIHGIPEDDPRNPATIADNVGDNVGDIAGHFFSKIYFEILTFHNIKEWALIYLDHLRNLHVQRW